jgi:transposase
MAVRISICCANAYSPRHETGENRRDNSRRPCAPKVRKNRILAEVARIPDREQDGTATWSLSTLQAALRHAKEGLPTVSTYTIWRSLHAARLSWQKNRTWCATGVVVRKHEAAVVIIDRDAAAKKS